MSAMTDDTKQIEVGPAFNPVWAAIDIRVRVAAANKLCGEFFNDPDHQDRVAHVQAVIKKFFTVYKGMYVNQRTGKGKPFTVVKVDFPVFPNKPASVVEREYRAPLREIGVEIVFSKRTNSYLYRIY